MLQKEGIPTAVVSMPCRLLFEQQDAAYRKAVLGKTRARVAVEAAVETRLGALYRPRRPLRRHARVRRLRQDRRRLQEVRHQRRSGGARRKGNIGRSRRALSAGPRSTDFGSARMGS